MKLVLCLVITLCVVVNTQNASAQCDPRLQTDEGFVAPIGVDKKPMLEHRVEGTKVFPEYLFEIQDEPSKLRYRIVEFKQNQNRLFLDVWCMNKIWEDLTPAVLSNMSRTKNFPVKPDDKISFYREFYWYLGNVDPNSYHADHNIAFSVELIDSKTNKRLSLIDTIRIARQIPAGKPSLYSLYPVVSTVQYSVPQNIRSESAYLKVNVYMDGGSEKKALYRVDGRGIDLSNKHENDPWWKAYAVTVNNYNSYLNDESKQVFSLLTLPSSGTVGSPIVIGVNERVDESSILQITDGNTGDVIFRRIIGSDREITATISRPGVYVVSISNSDNILESQKILLNN